MADTTTANGGSIDTLKANAQSAYTQVANGPVAQSVKDQSAITTGEFSNLANARQTPARPAATGQPLTHYHSFFSELLSWNNPRASAIAYAAVVSTIFAARYLDVLRLGFRLTWMVLGVTIAAEVVGKTVMNAGLATQLRPRKYYTVPRETLDMAIGDVHELVNFLVIESQRIVFAENVWASLAVAVSAFLSYWAVKVVPYWGLALIATTVLFTAPLIYTSNQELIDHHLRNAGNVINAQTSQLKDVTAKHTANATNITKQYVGDYTSKASELLQGRSTSPKMTTGPSVTTGPTTTSTRTVSGAQKPLSSVKATDFPAAPAFPVAPQDNFKQSAPSGTAPLAFEKEPPLAS